MALVYRSALIAGLLALIPAATQAQVFVVGEKTATDGIATDFKPTHVELPQDKLTERGRRELIRNLESEQGFAHRALPMGAGLTLMANGHVSPSPDTYKKMLYEKGQSAGPAIASSSPRWISRVTASLSTSTAAPTQNTASCATFRSTTHPCLWQGIPLRLRPDPASLSSLKAELLRSPAPRSKHFSRHSSTSE